MRFSDKVDEVTARFESAGLAHGQGMEDAASEALFLVTIRAGFDFADLDNELTWDSELDCPTVSGIDAVVDQRIRERKPLPYLLGESYFCGHRFYVDDNTIIPRSYFSEWIPERFEPWIDSSKVDRILDLCTGSGCIAVSSALAFPEAQITATDLSAEALGVAKKNVERYGLENRVELVQGDLFDPVAGRFDILLCNPPYVSDERMDRLPAEFRMEPDMAFRGGSDGLDIVHRILAEARTYLNPGGVLMVESGSASPDLEKAYPTLPFTWLGTEFDEMVIFLLTREDLELLEATAG